MKITPIFLIVAQASPPAVLLSLAPIAPVAAQLTPDNTLGAESSVVTTVGPTGDRRINGGAARGSNLFHSFSEFNVEGGRSVYFSNPQGIENILTRVTGGNASNINGRLGVLGEANLFLVNPNGIVFGPDASLDINGSFYATTGDGIKLGEDGLFSATNLDPNELLQVQPSALFHNALANHMATLNNQASLAVPKGEHLVLHGGTVTNSGSLTAPGGTVMVLGESIGLWKDALIDVSDSNGGGNVFIGGLLQGRGNITAERTYIGPDATISSDALETGDGGRVIVSAWEITGFYGNISARGGIDGGDGGFVEVSGESSLIFRGEVDTTANFGKAGTLLLDSQNIAIANGSESGSDVTIYESQLEGLSGETNLVLQATNDIVVADLSDDSLNFARGTTGDITFIADADTDGVGDFSMADPADTINTNGRDIAITGASLTLGNIDTSLPAPDGAGELLSTAAIVSTGPGEPLNSISGNLFGGEDVDLYQIYLTGEGTFSATTIDGSNVDTQLFLFDADGLGLYGNDDNRAACSCPQSTLPGSGTLTPTTPGRYYLGINVFGVNPVSESGEIFATATTTSNLLEPTGAGSALPLVGWENVRGDAVGDYTIALTGVEAASATFAEAIGNSEISNSGAITLTATNGNITAGDLNGASFSGAGGEIRLDAAADIVLNGSRVDSSGVVGGGGEITLNSGGKIELNSSFLTSSTNGVGDAGKVTITARDTVRFSGGAANNRVNSDGLGDAGGIEITTGSLSVLEGAALSASTRGKGDAGKIVIAATERVLFAGFNSQGTLGGAFSVVSGSGEGDAGGIEITTGSLSVMEGAVLSASTSGKGDAGTLSIAATERVLFAGNSSQEFGSLAFSRVGPSAEGDAGGIEITTGSLDLTDGARLNASTRGIGDAATLSIEAVQTINISGKDSRGNSSGLFVETGAEAIGKAGSIILSTADLNLRSAAVIAARTQNDSRGGNIELNINRLSVTGGAQISSSSFSSGDAGTISIDAPSSVTIAGIDKNPDRRGEVTEFDAVDNTGPESAILSSALSTGTGGNIILNTDQLQVRDGALLSASSEEGVAGSLNLTANVIRMNNGKLSAETAEGNQGNITIDAPFIVLRDRSGITTNARGTATGGNITIATENLVARDNSDISANAIDGRGGNISITGSGVFLDRESQITATSERGIDGTVEINNEVERTRGLVELDNNPLDPEKIIAQNFCVLAKENDSSFTITGRGGIAIDPGDYLTGSGTQVGLVDPVTGENYPTSSSRSPENRDNDVTDNEIRQAQGWVQLADGTVVLTSYPVISTLHGPLLQHPDCNG